MSKAPHLDRGEILGLFRLLSERAHLAGIRIDLFLVGGAAMAVAYNTDRVTKDIDAIFEPKSDAYRLIHLVADEMGLPSDWVNDAIKLFLFPGNEVDQQATVCFEEPGLVVRVASPRYLFKMKIITGRASDEDDLRVLWPLCEYESAEACLQDIEDSYPEALLNPGVRYRVENLASEHHIDPPSLPSERQHL
jgi:hypothetical protein